MVQASNGDWLRRSQPMRHVRREARWALQESEGGGGDDKHAPTTRLPVVGGVRADVSLLRVGASLAMLPNHGHHVYSVQVSELKPHPQQKLHQPYMG